MISSPSLFGGALLAAVVLVPSGAAAAPDDAIDLRALSDSKVTLVEVGKPGNARKAFVAATIVNAPLAQVCAVLQDYPSYPAFMPNTASTVVTQGADHAVIDVTLKLPMGKIKKYRLRMEPKSSPQSCVLSWKLLPWPGLKKEETIADTTGAWRLSPGSTPASAVLRYEVQTDPGPIPFGLGWIVDSLSKDSIPQTLNAVRERAVGKGKVNAS